MNTLSRLSICMLAAGVLTTACTSTLSPPAVPGPNASLDNAARVVERAAADRNVTQYAAVELQNAQQMLRTAESTWTNTGDMANTSHLAYLAHQRAATAMELANQRAAEDAIKLASAQRQQLLADAHMYKSQQQAEQLQREEQFQQDMANLHAQNDERGIVIVPSGTMFAVDEAVLPAEAEPSLDQLATVLKNNPERKIAIEGHADSQGDQEHNMPLSEARANAVREALMSRGIDASRIIIRPYGEMYPTARNDTPSGRQHNRRIEVILSDVQGNVLERTSATGE